MKKPLNLATEPRFDIIDELKNICVKIPILQELKYVPIYASKGFMH